MAVKIKIKKEADLPTPKYAHKGDAGFDLYAAEAHTLAPMEKKVVKTGIKMEIPEGYVGLVWDRSGLAAKNSIHNLAGVIDSHYRGEVGIVMMNLGKEKFEVTKGMRIAQMLIQPVASAELVEVDELSETQRGDGGFGSTGTH
ncbi:dUTP diphosphatase [Candidatus Woesearchaeota archaeon]|nr:dUTP diphosphatase [Candidatus Woesearchaeota archaeon]